MTEKIPLFSWLEFMSWKTEARNKIKALQEELKQLYLQLNLLKIIPRQNQPVNKWYYKYGVASNTSETIDWIGTC